MKKILASVLFSCLASSSLFIADVQAAELKKTQLPSSEQQVSPETPRGPKVITNAHPSKHSAVNATEIKDAGNTALEEAVNDPDAATEDSYKPSLISSPNADKFRVKKLSGRKTMALALGGGGARGAAHVGILRVFEQENIPVDYIVGNSMGAIVGGLYCAGVDLDTLQKLGKNGTLRKAYVPKLLSVFLIPVSKIIPHQNKCAGISTGKKFQKSLTGVIPDECISFDKLRIPFSAVATNLIDGNAYRISDGDLASAIRASSTIYPLLKPVKIGEGLYVDGGMRANLPASAARDTGADIVVAVLVDEPLRKIPADKFHSYKSIASRLGDILLAVTDEHQLQFADIIINPDVSGIPLLSEKPEDVDKAVAAGEEAARKALPLIRKKMGLPADFRLVKSEAIP